MIELTFFISMFLGPTLLAAFLVVMAYLIFRKVEIEREEDFEKRDW